MDFNKLVHLARPTLKPNSVNAYATSLRVLAPDDATSLDFLLDSSKIIAQIEKFKHTTRRNYLNAVIVVLKGDEGQAENDTAIQKYEKERDKYNAEYSDAAGGVRSTQHAILKGDTQQALGIMRDTAKDQYAAGKSLKSAAKSVLERK